jgi:twitching motility two-component system response regulator PilG
MTKETFSIASIGFDERDQNVLLTVVTLAKKRKPGFILFESTPTNKQADILLVDADKPDAVKRWSSYLKLNEGKANISSLLLCAEPPPPNAEDKNHYIKKPMVATRLMTALEETVIADHKFTPPQVFEGEDFTASQLDLGMAALEAKPTPINNIAALVVDDSLPVRIQMKKALMDIAGRVDFAETGEQAEQMLDQNRYDIVFLDVILPGVDGYDICKKFKKNPDKGKTPVIMLTSNSSPADQIKGKMAGCDTYLIKPVNQNIFREVIREYLNLDD